jgi:hypothetical protein
MSLPWTEARTQLEEAVSASASGWGKALPFSEAIHLSFTQQAAQVGPRWAILEWKDSQPENWGLGLDGQSQVLQLWLVDRGISDAGSAESRQIVRSRMEELAEELILSLQALAVTCEEFRLDLGPPSVPIKALAEKRESLHLALFSCKVTAVWSVSG